MKSCRIAILGSGTVGSGVLELLAGTREECERRAGRSLEVVRLVVAEPARARAIPDGLAPEVSGDTLEACRDPRIDLVVELVGGIDAPREWIRTALEAGKDVVTANKAVLAAHGEELFAVAHERGRRLLFEASVAGAIPILQVLREGLPAGPIDRLTGILNSTSNRIIGRVEEVMDLAEAVAEAQRQGFAERDPSLDLSGADAAHKLALLARVITAQAVPFDAIRTEGIERIEPIDLAFGARHGWVLKPLAMLARAPAGVALGVYPAWVAGDSELAAVRDEYNAVLLEARPFGTMILQGKGAGRLPTAGSIIGDILRAARGEGSLPPARGTLTVLDPAREPARHYLRFIVPDRAGVLARIAGALGSHQVSIAGVEQPENHPQGRVPVHIITHRVATPELDRALDELAGSDVVSSPPLRIRLEGRGEEEA
ncbi:MAG: homoserine dehydrogenase [Planctomycetota bacterium]